MRTFLSQSDFDYFGHYMYVKLQNKDIDLITPFISL